MLYVARVLHATNGEVMRNKVVVTENGVVKDIYSFCNECHSMLFVDEVYISLADEIPGLHEIVRNQCLCQDGDSCAYVLDCNGTPLLLE